MPEPTSPTLGTVLELSAVLAAMGLYGITCMQTFLYYVHYGKKDRLGLKLLVAYLWSMNTTHQILTNRGLWVLVSRVHNPFILSREYLWAGLFTSLVTLPTQLFFTLRIYRFSNNSWIVPLIFVPCSLFQLGGYIAFLVICLNGGPTAAIIAAIRKLPLAFWGVGAAEDILISATLVYLIWSKRDREALSRTTRLLHRLTVFIINTGMWTAVCAFFTIVMLAAYPDFQAYVALYLVICPLYCNTLLANLNARDYIRGDLNEDSTVVLSRPLGRISFARFRNTTAATATSDQPSTDASTLDMNGLSLPASATSSTFRKADQEKAVQIVA